MKQRDLEAISSILCKHRALLGDVKDVAVMSATKEETNLIEGLFPGVTIYSFNKESWNIEERKHQSKFDIVIAANVFMCIKEVKAAIDNILASAKFAVIQDIVRGWRNGDSELSVETGDIMRYSFPQAGHHARISEPFNMDTIKQIKDVHFYDDAPGFRHHDNKEMDALKFVAFLAATDEKNKTKIKTVKADVIL